MGLVRWISDFQRAKGPGQHRKYLVARLRLLSVTLASGQLTVKNRGSLPLAGLRAQVAVTGGRNGQLTLTFTHPVAQISAYIDWSKRNERDMRDIADMINSGTLGGTEPAS